jgi:hypothetical protein
MLLLIAVPSTVVGHNLIPNFFLRYISLKTTIFFQKVGITLFFTIISCNFTICIRFSWNLWE